MFSKVGRILLISFALLFVFAKAEEDALKIEEDEITADNQETKEPEELDVSTFNEDEEAMNEPADSDKTADNDEQKRALRRIPFYRCPFNCGKACVVKRLLKRVRVGKSWRYIYGHVCFIGVHRCCQRCCKTYQTCRRQNVPEWICYSNALSCICRCRKINPLVIKG